MVNFSPVMGGFMNLSLRWRQVLFSNQKRANKPASTPPESKAGDWMGQKKNDVAIRPLCDDDAEGLCHNCFPDESTEAVADYIQRALKFVERGQGAHLVAESAGEPIANAQLICWHKRAEIGSLVVAEPYRGKGIGTALIDALSQAAADLGAEQIEIGAEKNNTRVLNLYRRLGFVPYKEVHIPRHNQRDERIVYLIKQIVPPPNGRNGSKN